MSMIPIGDDARDDGRSKVACLICGNDFEPVGRSRHCSQRCAHETQTVITGQVIRP